MNARSARAKTAPSLSVPLVRFHGGQFRLENIEEVFGRADIANAKVVIISMCGAMQCGKSLALNHFYEHMSTSRIPLSPRNTKPPKKCFDWTNSKKAQRTTAGIHITKKPVIIRHGGENLAVFLMDCEGINVHKCDSGQQLIYTLVTLFSSFQIINVEKDIRDQDLYPLKVFMSTYDELKDNGQKALFESHLLFLIRDSNTLKYKLGDEDEQAYLSKSFSTGYKRTVQVRMRRAFSNIGCFLMPHPGAAATVRQLKHQFKGSLKEFNETFETLFADLMERVLKPENLHPKIVNGNHITCKEFPDYIEACFAALDGRDLCKGLLKILTHTRFQPLVDKYTASFIKSLKAYSTKTAISEEEFSEECETKMEEIMEDFNCSESPSSLSEEKEKYCIKLQNELRDVMETEKENAEQFHSALAKQMNKDILRCKKTYEMELQTAINQGIGDRAMFDRYHENAMKGVLSLFGRKCKEGGERFIEKAKSTLKEIICGIRDSKLEDVMFEDNAVCENPMETKTLIEIGGGKLEHEACVLEFQPGTFASSTEISCYVCKNDEPASQDDYVLKSPELHFEPRHQRLRKNVKCKIPCWYITLSDEADAEKNILVLQKRQTEWVKIHEEVMGQKTYVSCELSSLSPIRLAWSSGDYLKQVATILYQNTCGNFIAKFFNIDENSIMNYIKQTAKAERYLTMSDLNTVEVKPSDQIEISLSAPGYSTPAVRRFAAKDIFSKRFVRSEQFISPSVNGNETSTEMHYEVRVNGCSKIFSPFRVDLNNPGRPDTAQPGPIHFSRTDARGDYMTVATGSVEANY